MELATTAQNREIAAKVGEWSSIAKEALADNTLRAYKVDGRVYSDYCKANDLQPIPANPQTVIAFIKSEADKGRAFATIKRRLATISQMHKAAEQANPADSELVKLTIKGLAKRLGTDQAQAPGISLKDTITIKALINNSIKDLRDYALLLVGRDLLARSYELVSLTIDNLEYVEHGAVVTFRRTKTETDSHSYYIGQDATEALKAWLDAANIRDGFIFQSLTRGHRATGRAISTRDVRRILKEVGQLAGIDASGHSVRVGMTQDLIAANADLPSIMQAGAWKSAAMPSRYGEKITAQRGAVAQFHNK
jgi:site-specific recombinase XerD